MNECKNSIQYFIRMNAKILYNTLLNTKRVFNHDK